MKTKPVCPRCTYPAKTDLQSGDWFCYRCGIWLKDCWKKEIENEPITERCPAVDTPRVTSKPLPPIPDWPPEGWRPEDFDDLMFGGLVNPGWKK